MLNGSIMFPTTHDIVPDFIDETIYYLKKFLRVGNNILITSKPDYSCIREIVDSLLLYKSQIVFRFTIGSLHDDVLKFWEPNAPNFNNRLCSLKKAFYKGFETSVSCEPFLDGDIVLLVDKLLPFITDVIWIGKMNKIESRVDTSDWSKADFRFLELVKSTQTDDVIWKLFNRFKDNSKIRWKDSIKKVVGLPEEEIG
jgi:DNA repair photolyase